MSINTDPEKISLDDLVNARTVSAVIQAFFGSSQLSQFMDQTNPLAELTHKRRLSALGPGGLTRERAGFEVRDVHYSQYGRMCPIETPEGPNIGLITSLATLRAGQRPRLHRDAVPRREERQGHRRDRVARRQPTRRTTIIAQANAPLNDDGTFAERARALPHRATTTRSLPPDRIDYMDVAPEQLVSIAAALIPFLEHDDANRALMGSNMQRQARAAPLSAHAARRHGARGEGGRGLGRGRSSRAAAVSVTPRHGRRDHRRRRPAERRRRGGRPPLARLTQHDRYRLKKYWRTNQDTAINQRPLVQHGPAGEAGRRPRRRRRHRGGRSSRSAATCWWRSCRGTGTTSRTPSCSPSGW